MPATTSLITGVDFVSVPTKDLARAMQFYGDTLGLPYAVNPNHLALHVDDVAAARAELESRGVEFAGDILDTSVCHMAFFTDPDGNRLMLHHRYAPREANG